MARSNSGKPGSSRSAAGEARKRAARKKRLLTKRQFRLLATASIVALVVAIGSVAVFAFQRGQEEQVYDLSQVGTGVPAVVQVHDFTCPVCTELRETVQVIEDEFDESELLIRIADVHSDEGLAFAARYTTARRATLLFISGNGELVDVRSGEASAAVLRERFQRHIAGEM